MKKTTSVKKICKFCRIFYRFNKLYLICKIKKHNKHQ